MEKKLPIVLLIFVIVLSLVAGVLFFKIADPFNRSGESGDSSVASGENELVVSHADSRSDVAVKSVVLNSLEIVGTDSETIDVDGQSRSVLNVVVKFSHKRSEEELIIPVMNSIETAELGPEGSKNKRTVSKGELNLERGQKVNIAFSYVPQYVEDGLEEVTNYCERAQNEACLSYIDIGFGNRPVDFDSYLEEVLNSEGQSKIDLAVTFPNTIFFR